MNVFIIWFSHAIWLVKCQARRNEKKSGEPPRFFKCFTAYEILPPWLVDKENFTFQIV